MDNKVVIVFVILHYNTIEDTIECVEYIKKNTDIGQTKIVIVDNASPNGTGHILEDMYHDNNQIRVICNDKNLGFAKGNNVGFYYAKKEWNPEFIILMNNDVLLLETQFYKKIKLHFVEKKYAVLGPMIVTKDGKWKNNPTKVQFKSLRDVEKFIKRYEFILLTMKLKIYPICRYIGKIRRIKELKKIDDKEIYCQKAENVKLHGCFLVLSKEYIKNFEGLDDRTFLYLEEDILYFQMMKEGMKMLYVPDIIVYHKEDSATNSIYKKQDKKREFIVKEYIHSAKVLKEIYQEKGNK